MEWDDEVWDQRHHLLYLCRISRIYHLKRERFFDTMDSCAKAVAILGGAAALQKVMGQDILVYVLAAITCSSTFSLVFAWSKKARSHADLAKLFLELEGRIIAKGFFDEAQLGTFWSDYIKAEATETRSLGALVVLAENELAATEGRNKDIKPVNFLKRLFAQILDFDFADNSNQNKGNDKS